jgi:hypothetical protein
MPVIVIPQPTPAALPPEPTPAVGAPIADIVPVIATAAAAVPFAATVDAAVAVAGEVATFDIVDVVGAVVAADAVYC